MLQNRKYQSISLSDAFQNRIGLRPLLPSSNTESEFNRITKRIENHLIASSTVYF